MKLEFSSTQLIILFAHHVASFFLKVSQFAQRGKLTLWLKMT